MSQLDVLYQSDLLKTEWLDGKPKLKTLLIFVKHYTSQYGYFPYRHEIGRKMKWRSIKTVDVNVKKLISLDRRYRERVAYLGKEAYNLPESTKRIGEK